MVSNGTIEQQIRERAYAIWQQEGCPNGRELDHWLAAEHEHASAEPKTLANVSKKTRAKPAKGGGERITPASRKAPPTPRKPRANPGK